jgi:hypothetical protein
MEARNGETGAQETDSSRFPHRNRLSTNPANLSVFLRACPPEQQRLVTGSARFTTSSSDSLVSASAG